MQRIAVLGSTGSIGVNCLQVIASQPDRMLADSLVANSNWQATAVQAHACQPRFVVIADAARRDEVDLAAFPPGCQVLFGPEAVEQVAADPAVDAVVCGIVGAAGLNGAWAALSAGKRVCLANKETLVVAGPLVTALARQTGAKLLPVDSEHSAVFQALECGRPQDVRRVILTASGGPFRGWTAERLADVTPAQALAHPTWNMGRRISVDSATLMNKALEVIEARWLFSLGPDQIDVVVHPQSIVHSLVEYLDGSVLAQLSPPDMRLPIQYALTWPERTLGISPRMDWRAQTRLDFFPPDRDSFPALNLGFEAAARGGTCGAALNAADERAVELFLNGRLSFLDIPRACRAVLDSHTFDPNPSLTDLFRLDRWARAEVDRWVS